MSIVIKDLNLPTDITMQQIHTDLQQIATNVTNMTNGTYLMKFIGTQKFNPFTSSSGTVVNLFDDTYTFIPSKLCIINLNFTHSCSTIGNRTVGLYVDNVLQYNLYYSMGSTSLHLSNSCIFTFSTTAINHRITIKLTCQTGNYILDSNDSGTMIVFMAM